jgi:hypothetical protein
MTTLRAGMGVAIFGSVIAMALGVSSPAVAQTAPVSFPRTADPIVLPLTSSELPSVPHRTHSITFNESGDLEVRFRDVAMTMAYNPPEDVQSSPGRLRTAQKLDVPAISGIIIRVSMGF